MAQAPWYRVWLLVGLACALALMIAAAAVTWRSRRVAPAAMSPLIPGADLSEGARWAVVLVAATVMAGPWGAGACAVAWGVKRWLPARAGVVVPAAVGALALTSGLVLAAGPWPQGYSGDSIWAAAPVILAVVLAVAPWDDRRQPAPRSGVPAVDT